MQSITVSEKNSNVKIEKYLQTVYPDLPFSALQKAFRKRDIKANGARVGRDYIVMPGDKLEIYIIDDILYRTEIIPGSGTVNRSDEVYGSSSNEHKSGGIKGTYSGRGFTVVYEDENILIVNKEQGIPVHPDKEQSRNTLIDLARVYLKEKDESTNVNGAINSAYFQPSLCHRLDRNTGGLVIIAKNQTSLDAMTEKIEARQVKKYYQCLVAGKMEKHEALLKAWLWKDAGKSRVYINDHRTAGSVEIITGYKIISYSSKKDLSLLEVELVTGRTHQIRAHLAHVGHPIIGDGKYGINSINRSFGLKQQALWACKLKFVFSGKGTLLDYLDGSEFSVDPGFDSFLK